MKFVVILTALGLASAAVLVSGDALAHKQGGARFERLKAADANGDGLLSRAEVQGLPRLAERFEALDADRDGQLTRDELRAGRRGHGRHGQRLLAALDGDGDGRVSKAEALARAEQRFDRLDANRDGFVSPEELRAHRLHGARLGQ